MYARNNNKFRDPESDDNHSIVVPLLSNSGELIQPFGYVDDFPSKFYQKPKTSRDPNEASFLCTPNMKKHFCHRRNLDLINQCRYLAAKKGMSKRELKKSIRKDEIEGKNYALTGDFFARHEGLRRESYIDPHGMNFMGGCWHLPPATSNDFTFPVTSCPPPPSPPQESPQFVTFTQPNVVLSAGKHGESFVGHKKPLYYHPQPVFEQAPMDASATMSRPVSAFGYFNEMYDDCGSSVEDTDLNEYLMDTAHFINGMGFNQYCIQEQQPYSSPSFVIPPAQTCETHKFSFPNENEVHLQVQEEISPSVGSSRVANHVPGQKVEESLESVAQDSSPQIAKKDYFPYSDDSEGCMSDYSTTDETEKITKNASPTVAQSSQSDKTGSAFGTRKIQILKKSDSSIFGSRDEYGEIVGSNS